MKAIVITQEIKDKNKKYALPFVTNNAVGTLVKTQLPSKFFVTTPFSADYQKHTELHALDGFLEIVVPENYNPLLHELGELYEVQASEKTKRTSRKTLAKKLDSKEATTSYATYRLIDKSQAQIEAEQKALTQARLNQIDAKATSLTKGAIAILLGVQGLTNEQMENQIELYRVLTDACLVTDTNPLVDYNRQIYNAENQETKTLQEYKDLVITKQETFIAEYDNFKLMIEVVRKKWKTCVLDTTKFLAIESILENLNETTPKESLPAIFQQIMNV
ncbi:MAG: hypothetical protein ACPG6B_01425 [Oceanihabitans sp.]